MIASSTDEDQGNAVVIDLNGDDTYHGAPLELATGRLWVELLIDHDGGDVYQLDMGSRGAGFGGLGLLLDAAENNRNTSHGFAIGLGSPLGVGAVIDTAGDDHYQCGDTYPSAYNPQDTPTGKPGDPLYQYDCFGRVPDRYNGF